MNKLLLPQIIGHRGAAGYAPENTLEGIHTAADMDIEWVELDVKLTKDQIPVLFHDETLERTTNGSGNMADFTLDDLRQLDAGYHFSDSFAGVRIPTLEEAIDVLIERGLGLNLELKPCAGREIETAEVALDLLSHIWDDHSRLLISSFSHVSLETSLDMAEDWHRGFILPEEWPENWREFADHLNVSALVLNGNTLTEEQATSALEMGKQSLAYTVNDPAQAHVLQSQGIGTVISDEPDVIAEGIFTVH